jgi:hypothetical protein
MEYRRPYGTLEENEQLYQGLLEKGIEAVDDKTKTFFRKKMLVSLETLMEKFPGHYIHLVCRSTPRTFSNYVDVKEATQEIALKRVLYMTPKQIRRDMGHIQKSRRNRVQSKFSVRSNKSVNNMLMSGFQRSLMHNEFRRKTPRLRAIRENSNSNSNYENSVDLPTKTNTKTKTKAKTETTPKTKTKTTTQAQTKTTTTIATTIRTTTKTKTTTTPTTKTKPKPTSRPKTKLTTNT